VSRTEISAIETGRLVPSVAVALRLAEALGQSVEALFGRATEPRGLPLAWRDATPSLGVWLATLGARVLAYPVESTAAGSIPHDHPGGESGHVPAIPAGVRPDRTLVVAGCDPMVGLLVHELRTRHDVRVLPLLRSSAQALDLLRRGLVHVAGVHFSDSSGGTTNDARVRAAVGGGYRLLHQMVWDTGIAVAGDRKEQTAGALLRANVRWVNREEGSAARQAFDVLLASRRRPAGYSRVVRDHRAVAATVSSGWAEAGICVRPAAAEARLRFITLHREAYELCIANAMADEPRIAALIATLQSAAYRGLVAHAPGCVSRETGSMRVVA
jgi:molybdate-binding protein